MLFRLGKGYGVPLGHDRSWFLFCSFSLTTSQTIWLANLLFPFILRLFDPVVVVVATERAEGSRQKVWSHVHLEPCVFSRVAAHLKGGRKRWDPRPGSRTSKRVQVLRVCGWRARRSCSRPSLPHWKLGAFSRLALPVVQSSDWSACAALWSWKIWSTLHSHRELSVTLWTEGLECFVPLHHHHRTSF